jgi:hypothetical protein
MLVGRLAFIARDILYNLLENLLTFTIVALFLSVNKLSRPYPCKYKAEVIPSELGIVPFPREDTGIVLCQAPGGLGLG